MNDLQVLGNTIEEVLQETKDLREANRVTYQLIGMSGRVQFSIFSKIIGIEQKELVDILNNLTDLAGGGSILGRLESMGVVTSKYFDESDDREPDEDEEKNYGFTAIGALYFYHMFMSPARDEKTIPIYSLLKMI